jgi:hypothetical protein
VSDVTATFAPTVALGKRYLEAEKLQGDGGVVEIIPTESRTRGKPGPAEQSKESWRQRDLLLGPTMSRWPGFLNFTTCWKLRPGPVSSRAGWWMSHKRVGTRGKVATPVAEVDHEGLREIAVPFEFPQNSGVTVIS